MTELEFGSVWADSRLDHLVSETLTKWAEFCLSGSSRAKIRPKEEISWGLLASCCCLLALTGNVAGQSSSGGGLMESFQVAVSGGGVAELRYVDVSAQCTRAPGLADADQGLAGVSAVGHKAPIAFIHGLGCASTLDYAAVAASPALAGRRRVLVDLMGFGASDRPERFDYTVEGHARCLDGLLERLGPRQMVLYGHSMGGAVALSLARRNPDRIAGMILAEANLDPGGGASSREIAGQEVSTFVERGHADLHAVASAEGNPWANTVRLASPAAMHASAKSLVKGTDPSWREILYGLDCPRYYLFGAASLPDPDLDELPRHGVQTGVIPGAGNNMAWENPAGLADGIARCLEAMA